MPLYATLLGVEIKAMPTYILHTFASVTNEPEVLILFVLGVKCFSEKSESVNFYHLSEGF